MRRGDVGMNVKEKEKWSVEIPGSTMGSDDISPSRVWDLKKPRLSLLFILDSHVIISAQKPMMFGSIILNTVALCLEPISHLPRRAFFLLLFRFFSLLFFPPLFFYPI